MGNAAAGVPIQSNLCGNRLGLPQQVVCSERDNMYNEAIGDESLKKVFFSAIATLTPFALNFRSDQFEVLPEAATGGQASVAQIKNSRYFTFGKRETLQLRNAKEDVTKIMGFFFQGANVGFELMYTMDAINCNSATNG